MSRVKLLSSPDSFPEMKKRWFFSSNDAFTPASFNFAITSLTLLSAAKSTTTESLPLRFTLIEKSSRPKSAIVVLRFTSPSSLVFISEPVRYAVWASSLILSVCVPATASEDAETFALLLSETLADFLT